MAPINWRCPGVPLTIHGVPCRPVVNRPKTMRHLQLNECDSYVASFEPFQSTSCEVPVRENKSFGTRSPVRQIPESARLDLEYLFSTARMSWGRTPISLRVLTSDVHLCAQDHPAHLCESRSHPGQVISLSKPAQPVCRPCIPERGSEANEALHT